MMDMDDLERKIDDLHFDPSNVNITGPYRKLNEIRNQTKVLSVRRCLKYSSIVLVTYNIE